MPEREHEVFSNPMAPSHGAEEDEDLHPMTNDDFRKLMMTPRVPSAKSSTAPTPLARPAATTQSSKEDEEDDDLDPHTKRKQKKIYYAKLKRLEEERQKELASKYRDRATERRKGLNKDYSETETISTTADYRAVAPNAQAGATLAERRKQLIQESKYLGGDMEHTHLVKGLDYALLEKVRAEISYKEEEQEQEMDEVVDNKKEKEEDPEDKIDFRTKIGRNIYRTLFKVQIPERNELFVPGRMAYCVDLEDEYAETDIPTTVIRSKADIQNTEATVTLTTNDIVISKLTQILSYLRQGRRDRKKKLKEKAKREEDLKKLGVDDTIYTDITEYNPTVKKDKEKDSRGDRDRGDRRDRDRDRDRGRDRDRDRDRDRTSKRSYFEKPADEDDEKDGHQNLPESAKELVQSINSRFASHAAQASWTEKFPSAEKPEEKGDAMPPPSSQPAGKKKKSMYDSYAECYPGMDESYDAAGDSDEEVDYSKMDQGNKKGPVGRWDFDTQEEYSEYMSKKEALPKAAFQYGVKMADGRRTRRTGPKDEKKELDREWQKIQNIISKRKQMGMQGEPSSKHAKY